MTNYEQEARAALLVNRQIGEANYRNEWDRLYRSIQTEIPQALERWKAKRYPNVEEVLNSPPTVGFCLDVKGYYRKYFLCPRGVVFRLESYYWFLLDSDAKSSGHSDASGYFSAPVLLEILDLLRQANR